MLNDRLAIMNSSATPHPQHRPSQLTHATIPSVLL